MSESDGKMGAEQLSDRPCPYCESNEDYYRIWESSDGGFEDVKHHCRACGKTWWIDGIDS